ncbi:L-seryl-tRNA(Sec) selenium transferase [Clostridiaceae bacterium M8S5]|nr:L-seryl-tRNA(Sec) selenium transferase [Clostridiaceae bacterium M8S5]
MNRKLFSMLPKVDDILGTQEVSSILDTVSRVIVLEAVREEIEAMRKAIAEGVITSEQEFKDLLSGLYGRIIYKVRDKNDNKLKSVINCTGTVVHTNLGRSLLSNEAAEKLSELSRSYSNLEYDLFYGKRGSRYSHIEYIIRKITGAEATIVVNNNAAAVMLVLSTMAKEKEVVVSRGELVEIGGSFRIPDVMEQSGAKLVDVGTTNKTHARDYENAIGEDTAALLKVHTSNYRIVGFTESVSLDDMVSIGKKNEIPVIEDIGSGVLIDLTKYGLSYEPTVQESLKKGVDIVTFSGDKLLGGPQAGIIVGKKEYIDKMKKNPLTRAFRVDKFTITALETTLKYYLDEEEAIKNIPTLRMLTKAVDQIKVDVESLKCELEAIDENKLLQYSTANVYSQVGGGAMPLERIPSYAVEITSKNISINNLENMLRKVEVPIISRIYNDKMYLDLRTVKSNDIDKIKQGFIQVLKQIEGELS